MLSVSRELIKVGRTGSWVMHLHAIADCLPIFAAAGHTNYLKSAYLLPPVMQKLDQTTQLSSTGSSMACMSSGVVPDSGHGWENFGVRSVGAAGQLFALRGLDYELETHRRGFRFMVQVTDQGPWGWEDLQHVDSAWVTVRLLDVNDNPPLFSRPHAHVTVKEDAAPGTSLATLSARDPDAGSRQGVDYRLEGDWEALAVDEDGSVSLVRQLDREAPDGEEGVVLVVAVDRGSPPLSATATLTITVTDVNDCPPRLLPPTLLHVTEGSPPTKLGVLRVTDPDVWELGHGPPFFLSLAPTNTPLVLSLISLKFDPREYRCPALPLSTPTLHPQPSFHSPCHSTHSPTALRDTHTTADHFNSLQEPYNELFKKYVNTKQQPMVTHYYFPAGSPPPASLEVEDKEIERIFLAVPEDDDVVSNFDFGGFGSDDEGEAGAAFFSR
ncbi:hypothetical protein O3P69_013537 [Scylla paramamosain]|uniref:Cadherin domain-containing protein n=1 Tax=Scylla paramamosain TaxID=85552 RepID=A0AAW0SCL3_SCYPA